MRKIATKRIRDSHPQLGTKEDCIKDHFNMVRDIANQYDHLQAFGIDMDDLLLRDCETSCNNLNNTKIKGIDPRRIKRTWKYGTNIVVNAVGILL